MQYQLWPLFLFDHWGEEHSVTFESLLADKPEKQK